MTPARDPLSRVLEQIERGDVTMQSKVRILAGTAGLAVAAAFVFMLSVSLVSSSWFALRTSGVLLLPSLGFPGVRAFLAAFPWGLATLSLVLVAVLIRFVRLFPFAYRRPLAYSALLALGVSAAFGLALDRVSFHEALRARAADAGVLALVEPFYGQERMRAAGGVYVGTVERIGLTEVVLRTATGDITFALRPETRLPEDRALAPGDAALVLAGRGEEGLVAYGIRYVTDASDIAVPWAGSPQ